MRTAICGGQSRRIVCFDTICCSAKLNHARTASTCDASKAPNLSKTNSKLAATFAWLDSRDRLYRSAGQRLCTRFLFGRLFWGETTSSDQIFSGRNISIASLHIETISDAATTAAMSSGRGQSAPLFVQLTQFKSVLLTEAADLVPAPLNQRPLLDPIGRAPASPSNRRCRGFQFRLRSTSARCLIP
jgi:hypothetical protein